VTSRSEPPKADLPQRVSTLELFFDLVFVFTITQLTGMLASEFRLASAGRVLLIFGVLWWIYSATCSSPLCTAACTCA
jgi:low temperature requirement protein LtrA